MPASRRRVLAAVAAAASAAGCLGGDSTPGAPGPDETDTPTATATDTPTEATSEAQSEYPDFDWDRLEGADPVATTSIAMRDFAFHPLVAAVPPGSEVTVTNEDSATHTMTVPALGLDEELDGGESTSFTVEESGTADFVCRFHPPDMLGRLVVTGDADAGTATPTATPTTVQVRELPDLGEVLVGPEGMTLYMFDSDEQDAGESACHDDCAEAWPPLTVDAAPSRGDGVTADLATFERADGGTQVVAAGWPLYYYASDEEPGDATGQGVGDVWWVLRPDGTPARSSGGTDTPTATPTEDDDGY